MLGFGRKKADTRPRRLGRDIKTVPRVPRISVRMSALDTDSFKGGDNLIGNLFSTGDGDSDVRVRASVARRESRQMVLGNEFGRGYLRRLATNVVGPNGLQVQAQALQPDGQSKDKILNDRVEAEFKRWSRKQNCTLSKRYNLRQLQKLLVQSVARDGTVLVRYVEGDRAKNDYAFALQPLEIDYLDNTYTVPFRNGKAISQGVEVSGDGEILAYHILSGHPGDILAGGRRRVRVPADQMICLYDPDRLHQTQGLPWLIASVQRQKMLKSFDDAAVMAANEGAKPGGFFTEIEPADGEGNGLTADDLPRETFPGALHLLPTGHAFQAYTPAYPNQNYEGFRRPQVQAFAAGTNTSYPGLSKDYGQINYASLRQASLDERDEWQEIQAMLAEDFMEPVFLRWLDMAALTRMNWLTSRQVEALQTPWIQGRGWPWTNPLQDVTASEKAIQNGLASRRSILAQQGEDFEEVARQLKEEAALLEQLGLPLGNEVNKNGGTANNSRPDETTGEDDDTG